MVCHFGHYYIEGLLMNNNMSVGQNISLHVTDQYEWKSVVNELLQRSAVVRVTLRVCEIRGNQISESSIHFAAKPVLYLTAHRLFLFRAISENIYFWRPNRHTIIVISAKLANSTVAITGLPVPLNFTQLVIGTNTIYWDMYLRQTAEHSSLLKWVNHTFEITSNF